MPVDLTTLVNPARTALVTQECQGGVVGPAAALAELASEARREAIPNISRLLPIARASDVRVVHCLMHRRPDGLGANTNGRLFAAANKLGTDMSPGSEGGSLLPELGPEPSDFVFARLHGLSPMTGTDLDSILRNLGVTTLVVTGVSVNVAITNLVMDAANRGYQVVVPRDAVAGVPRAYAESVIDTTLSLLATVTTTDALATAWLPS